MNAPTRTVGGGVVEENAMAKFKVGDIVLHKDGQYECEVMAIIADGAHPYYSLKDLCNGSLFNEYESYLIGDDYEYDGPDEAQEWHDYDPDC